MITLLLSRHVTTWANEKGLWIGRMESEISPKGMLELEILKRKLEPYKQTVQGIYTSPSGRAKSTAQLVYEVLWQGQVLKGIGQQDDAHMTMGGITVVEALQEINFGQFEGKHFDWAKKNAPDEIEKMLLQKEQYCYPEGESLLQMHTRVAAWLQSWLRSHEEGTYWICAHGGTIRCILSELLAGDSHLHWRFKIEPASLSIVKLSEGYAVMETLNS